MHTQIAITNILIDYKLDNITLPVAEERMMNLVNADKQQYPKVDCGFLHSTDWSGKCFNCGKQIFIRE